MSPGRETFNPRGNRARGWRAAFFLFALFFLSIRLRLLRILPTVLADVLIPCLASRAWILYFDHAGYRLRIFTASVTIFHGVVGSLTFFGRCDWSLRPTIPFSQNRFRHLRIVSLVRPKCRAVTD